MPSSKSSNSDGDDDVEPEGTATNEKPETVGAFKCDYPSCKKTFTRKDHLIRHQANHSTTIFTCPTCHRPFKRLDLLQRHERRNVCTSEPANSANGGAWSGKGSRTSRGKRARSPSSSSSSGHGTSMMSRANAAASSSYLPSAGIDVGLQLTGFEMFEGWDPVFLPQEDWLPSLTESMAGPYNEPIIPVELPWNMTLTRAQESSARGQELMASVTLASRLQAEYPLYDFSFSVVTDYLRLYWSHVAPSFPFIHRGTLDLDSAPSYLVVLMLITGSVHSTHRQDFSPLITTIRGELVQQCGTDAPVSIFQAFTLCHIYDTWYGNQESLFVAQCMWSTVVAHSRKKGIGVQGASAGEGENEVWANWAKGEERRRAAYCVLMLDTQISAFWNQHSSRQLSIFAHDLPLPCPRSQWDATSAGDWLRARSSTTAASPSTALSGAGRRHARGTYLPGLHPEFRVTQVPEGFSSAILSAMVAQAELQFSVDVDSSLAVQMVLLGLMGTAWDHRIKGGMGIKFKEGAKHWRKLTQDALIHLRATWEGATQHSSSSAETRDMRDTFGISILSVLSDIPMLLALAGAPTICGSALSIRHFADAKKRCRLWAKTDDAFTCLWQSTRYLKQALFADWGVYTPWAVFLTTLVLYAYATTLPTSPPSFPRPSSTPTELTNALLDSILSSNTRPQLANEPILDLLLCVAEKLASKGELNRGNAALLWRLVEEGSALDAPILANTGIGGLHNGAGAGVGGMGAPGPVASGSRPSLGGGTNGRTIYGTNDRSGSMSAPTRAEMGAGVRYDSISSQGGTGPGGDGFPRGGVNGQSGGNGQNGQNGGSSSSASSMGMGGLGMLLRRDSARMSLGS